MAFVSRGDFGFASGHTEDGEFQRLWYAEPLGAAEVSFDADVYLLTKAKAEAPKACPPDPIPPQPGTSPGTGPAPEPDPKPLPRPQPRPDSSDTVLQLAGSVPPEVWNRIGINCCPSCGRGRT